MTYPTVTSAKVSDDRRLLSPRLWRVVVVYTGSLERIVCVVVVVVGKQA